MASLSKKGKASRYQVRFLLIHRYLELGCISCEIFVDVIFYRRFELKQEIDYGELISIVILDGGLFPAFWFNRAEIIEISTFVVALFREEMDLYTCFFCIDNFLNLRGVYS